jgi:hypothetical protein
MLVEFDVRTGIGTVQPDRSFSDALDTCTRLPSGELKNIVRYKNKRYQLMGGIRTNYFICLNNPLDTRKQ